jgi:hypothetical protein
MALYTGTATERRDLIKQVADACVAEGWTLLESTAAGAGYSKAILRAPGSGSEQIFVGLQSYADAINDVYGLNANGYTGYLAGADFWGHPGACATQFDVSAGNLPCVPLWNSGDMPFWLVVSGSRLVLVVKVGTVYESLYLGFLKRYGTPGEWPYPLVVGTSATAQLRFSDTSAAHTQFVDPSGSNDTTLPYSTLRVRDAAGAWQAVVNAYPAQSSSRRDHAGTWPFNARNWAELGTALRPALSGEYTMQPVVVTMDGMSGRANAIYGVLDGVFQAAGAANAAENEIDDGGVSHLVVQNTFRTAGRDFWALKLA